MAPQMPGSLRAGVVAGFAAIYLIWGSTYLAIRLGVADIPPFLMAGVRFLIGGIAFISWAQYRGAKLPTARDWITTGIIGVLMAVGGNGLVTWAEQTVPSGLAALLVSMVPFWVVIADWLRPRGHRPRMLVVFGVVLGFRGVSLLINPADIAGARELDLVGAGAIVLASMLWASGSVYSRYAASRLRRLCHRACRCLSVAWYSCRCRPLRVNLQTFAGLSSRGRRSAPGSTLPSLARAPTARISGS